VPPSKHTSSSRCDRGGASTGHDSPPRDFGSGFASSGSFAAKRAGGRADRRRVEAYTNGSETAGGDADADEADDADADPELDAEGTDVDDAAPFGVADARVASRWFTALLATIAATATTTIDAILDREKNGSSDTGAV
jgi:hypothetical protein